MYIFWKEAREEMVEKALVDLKGDQELKMIWLQCFENEDIHKHKVMAWFLYWIKVYYLSEWKNLFAWKE